MYTKLQAQRKKCFLEGINRANCLAWNRSFQYKSFWYELKRWNCTKILFTSSRVCPWTRKTFWLNILCSLSQLKDVKLFTLRLNILVSKLPLTFSIIVKTILAVWCNHINDKIQTECHLKSSSILKSNKFGSQFLGRISI